MGGASSKRGGVYNYCQGSGWRPAEDLASVLQGIEQMEKESPMLYAFKAAEASWKRERRRLEEEVKRLRKMVEEKPREKKKDEEGHLLNEAGEKWKQLYLAIKTELDDLIQKTYGEGIYQRAEEEMLIDELTKELKMKEETIETLNARVAAMEQEGSRREKEIDILRQSLRIMSCSRRKISPSTSRNLVWGHCIRMR